MPNAVVVAGIAVKGISVAAGVGFAAVTAVAEATFGVTLVAGLAVCGFLAVVVAVLFCDFLAVLLSVFSSRGCGRGARRFRGGSFSRGRFFGHSFGGGCRFGGGRV